MYVFCTLMYFYMSHSASTKAAGVLFLTINLSFLLNEGVMVFLSIVKIFTIFHRIKSIAHDDTN
jgi:hypothetical protein